MPQSLFQGVARSWILPVGPTLGIVAFGILYVRGWQRARRTRPRELPVWRALCFLAGLLSVWIALASPLDALNPFLLVAHMTQHVLLMSVAPPLLLLGNPVVPLLRGLPRSFVRDELAPWMNSGPIHWLERLFTHPMFGWLSMDAAVAIWHLPGAYELSLRSNFWHQIEHACFFFTAVAFWWYVIRPWPNRIRSSRWWIIPYVAASRVVLFTVGAILALDSDVVYPSYAHVPRLFGLSVMTDQALAGSEMLTVGLVVAIAAVFPILLDLLSDKPASVPPAQTERMVGTPGGRSAPPVLDLLHVPVAGPLLRSRYFRPALQGVSLAVLTAVILDGLFGVQVSAMNAAGAMVWNVIRPLSLILLLLIGNLFCMACPFTLPREAMRRLGIPQLRWPGALSSKWPAITLMLVFFWAYEQFALWNSPRGTALLLLSYVASATIINSAFRDASFCKYVCPVGQFSFIASLLAPLEVGVRSRQVCSSCAGHDCIRGNEHRRGCELKLYLPTKAGSLDCTLCMDCVQACPHDNVSLTPRSPLRELSRGPIRSSLGRISSRIDLAVLILLVVFSSLASAAVMTSPVAGALEQLRLRRPWAANPLPSLLATTAVFALLLLLYAGGARLMQSIAPPQRLRTAFCRFSIALLPLGLSVWAGHLIFHLASSWPSVPVLMSRISGLQGPPAAALQAARAMPQMTALSASMFSPFLGASGFDLFDLQVWILNLGLFLTWYAGWKLVRQMANSAGRLWSMWAIWAVGSTGLYAAAVWIFTQPMYMRGMVM